MIKGLHLSKKGKYFYIKIAIIFLPFCIQMTSTSSTQPINIVPKEDHDKEKYDSSLEPTENSYNENEDFVNSIPMSPSNFLW